ESPSTPTATNVSAGSRSSRDAADAVVRLSANAPSSAVLIIAFIDPPGILLFALSMIGKAPYKKVSRSTGRHAGRCLPLAPQASQGRGHHPFGGETELSHHDVAGCRGAEVVDADDHAVRAGVPVPAERRAG